MNLIRETINKQYMITISIGSFFVYILTNYVYQYTNWIEVYFHRDTIAVILTSLLPIVMLPITVIGILLSIIKSDVSKMYIEKTKNIVFISIAFSIFLVIAYLIASYVHQLVVSLTFFALSYFFNKTAFIIENILKNK